MRKITPLEAANARAVACGFITQLMDAAETEERGVMFTEEFREFIAFAFTDSHSRVTEVAKQLKVCRLRLNRLCRVAGVGPPLHWLALARLAPVAVLLHWYKEATVEEAARVLGMPDQFTMSNRMKSAAGCRPSERLDWRLVTSRLFNTALRPPRKGKKGE